MTDQKVIERETVTTAPIPAPAKTITTAPILPPATTETTYVQGPKPHGDEQVSGALAGGVAGAAVGAVVGGPVGAVVGGAIGAASGTTVGAIDEKDKDDVTITHEVTRP